MWLAWCILPERRCMQACDNHLARALPDATDWVAWLLLADRLQLKRLVGRCAAPAARSLFAKSDVRGQVLALSSMSQRSLQLMMETVLKYGQSIPGSSNLWSPFQTSGWAGPGDLF
jgi:hypothetical protein